MFALQILIRLNEVGLGITLPQLFRYQTVASLAEVAGTRASACDQGVVTGQAQLMPMQRWFLAQETGDPNIYGIPLLFTMAKDIDPDLLERSVWYVMKHHDALRLRFEKQGSVWSQFITETSETVPFEICNFLNLNRDQQISARDDVLKGIASGVNIFWPASQIHRYSLISVTRWTLNLAFFSPSSCCRALNWHHSY